MAASSHANILSQDLVSDNHLRSLQALALEVCSSIFLGDYLTSEGQAGAADLAMIADLGFEVAGPSTPRPGGGEVCWGHDERVLAAVGSTSATAVGAVRETSTDASGVPIRRHGPGAM